MPLDPETAAQHRAYYNTLKAAVDERPEDEEGEQSEEFEIHPNDLKDLQKLQVSDWETLGWGNDQADKMTAELREEKFERLEKHLGIRFVRNYDHPSLFEN